VAAILPFDAFDVIRDRPHAEGEALKKSRVAVGNFRSHFLARVRCLSSVLSLVLCGLECPFPSALVLSWPVAGKVLTFSFILI